jgi:hypothetical protein
MASTSAAWPQTSVPNRPAGGWIRWRRCSPEVHVNAYRVDLPRHRPRHREWSAGGAMQMTLSRGREASCVFDS